MARGDVPGDVHDEDPFADIEDPRLRALLERQTAELPRIVEELEAHGEKRSHWAWWAFPTNSAARASRRPRRASRRSSRRCCSSAGRWACGAAPSSSSATGPSARGDLVLPSIDHGRVVFFVAFWERLACTPAWFRDVLTRLDALLPVAQRRRLAKQRAARAARRRPRRRPRSAGAPQRRRRRPPPAPAAPAPAPEPEPAVDVIAVDETQAEAPAPKRRKKKRDILSDSSDDDDGDDAVAFPAYAFPGVPPRSHDWKRALRPPHASLAYASGRDGRLVYDGYPKARRHLLGLAAPGTALSRVNSVRDLRREHLPALQKLHAFCRAAAEALGTPCRVGYHARPSLEPLHVHIISIDLDSEFIKQRSTSFRSRRTASSTRRSWNGRLRTGALADALEPRDGESGACHRCGAATRNLPALKRHLAVCAPPPAAWDVVGRLSAPAPAPAPRAQPTRTRTTTTSG